MQTEFEIKFTSIDKELMIQKIINLWWECTKKRTLMRRVVFFHPTDSNSYLRIRDEWDKITTTYKYIDWDSSHIESIKELECSVSDFDTMKNIYLAMWLKQKAYQETYREVWKLNNEIEFMIDEWPWLYPFIEIEWLSQELVYKYVNLLWLSIQDGMYGTVDKVYLKELGIPCNILNTQTPEITFDNPPKQSNHV